VVAGSAELQVITGTACQRVVAVATEQGVIVEAAEDLVVAGETVDQVIAVITEQRVVRRRPVDRVIARTANGCEKERHFPSLSGLQTPPQGIHPAATQTIDGMHVAKAPKVQSSPKLNCAATGKEGLLALTAIPMV